MKKIWVVIAIPVFGAFFAAIAMNYHATHTGPFIYYRSAYPDLSAQELTMQGLRDINQFFQRDTTA